MGDPLISKELPNDLTIYPSFRYIGFSGSGQFCTWSVQYHGYG